jgi:hypothetical protein
VVVSDTSVLSSSVQAALAAQKNLAAGPVLLISSEFDAWSYSDIGVFAPVVENNQSLYTYIASAVAFPSVFAETNQRPNKGMEALCATPDGTNIIAGFERNLFRDPVGAIRLSMYDLSTGSLVKMLRYELGSPEKGTGLTELLALDDKGLDGGVLLSLERSYSSQTGSEIRLYVVSTARARDVGHCDALLDDHEACGVVRKEVSGY